jgi:hypothetical protein
MAQCQATTKRGTKCLQQALPGQPFCAHHQAYTGNMHAEAGALDGPRTDAEHRAFRAEQRFGALQENPLYSYVRAKAEAGDAEAIALLEQLGQ